MVTLKPFVVRFLFLVVTASISLKVATELTITGTLVKVSTKLTGTNELGPHELVSMVPASTSAPDTVQCTLSIASQLTRGRPGSVGGAPLDDRMKGKATS